MRWIFLTLLLLNALLVAVEWSERQGLKAELRQYSLKGGVERLTLLGESLDGSLASSVVATGELSERLCLLLGPMANRGAANKLLQAFDTEGVNARVVEQSITKAPNYWVYLAPFETRKVAIAKLRKLQSEKIDSYLITQGELANGISLGVFENIDSARRMLERRKNQGYSVQLTELGKREYEYWVAIMDENTQDLDVSVANAMESIAVSFEKRQIFCKSVASEKKLP